MTIWAPGMRCVCVDDDLINSRWEDDDGGVRRGVVYVVADTRIALSVYGDETLYLILAELPGHGFGAGAFRPLSETRLDQFRQHLNRIPADKVLA